MGSGKAGFEARVEQRVRANLALLEHEFTGYDRLAARHMFSEFCHLETIAVMAAERGDAIPGQLEDEHVHHETFRRLAEQHGGLVAPCEEVARLIDYLTSLEGEASLAALNVTAESWLETVFDHVAGWGACDALMRAIEEDEERHVHDALDLARPPAAEIEPIVRDLERMLEAIAVAPAFMLPLIHFAGEQRVCAMGEALCAAHERACAHLGIASRTHRVRLLCRSQRIWSRRAPVPMEMTDWDRTKQRIYDRNADMLLWFEIATAVNGYRLQAQVVAALARILQRHPRLRYVTRRGELFRAQEPIIAMRALYDDRAVMNVFLPGCHHRTWRGVLRQMNRRVKRARAVEYHAMPPMPDDLDKLLPPSRVAAAVNYNGVHGGIGGTGPLSDVEGIPILVTIGEVRAGRVTLTILMDHRTHDGQDIGLLKQELERELTSGTV